VEQSGHRKCNYIGLKNKYEGLMKKRGFEEQYFFNSVGGIFLLIFILIGVAIVRLKFFL
jgi:hypothetical protein